MGKFAINLPFHCRTLPATQRSCKSSTPAKDFSVEGSNGALPHQQAGRTASQNIGDDGTCVTSCVWLVSSPGLLAWPFLTCMHILAQEKREAREEARKKP